MQGKKDLKLLSFGDEEEDETPIIPNGKLKMMSAHDDKIFKSERLVPEIAPELIDVQNSIEPIEEKEKQNKLSLDQRLKEKIKASKTRSRENANLDDDNIPTKKWSRQEVSEEDEEDISPEEDAVKSRKEEFERMKQATLKARKAIKVLTGSEAQQVHFTFC